MAQYITLSDSARRQLRQLEVSHENALRLWVEAGGCSGMSYAAGIDSTRAPEDTVLFEDEEIRVITDPASLPHFAGLEVDYSDDLVRAGFRFSNPNALHTCGCGQSFQA